MRVPYKYVIFDRDGTLIEHVHHLVDESKVRLVPGTIECLEILVKKNFRFGIVTNQSVVGRKLATLEMVTNINTKFLNLIGNLSEYFDFIYICPHSPSENCQCRKPNPELGLDAIRKFRIDEVKSFMIGDQSTDLEFAKRIGLTPIIVHNKGIICENWFPDLLSAADFIVRSSQGG